jgi:CheY-like chemotaxis protein
MLAFLHLFTDYRQPAPFVVSIRKLPNSSGGGFMRTKLLLADDSITIQKVVGIIFSSEEYELAIVDNGNAALAKARENKPDVLLVDAVMPGKTGYEVCEEIRRDPFLKDIPILLLTGAFEPFDENKARQSGADDFISKPFESQHLIDKVTSLSELAGKRATAVSAPTPAAAPFHQAPPPETARPEHPSPSTPPAPVAEVPATQSIGGSSEFFTLTEEAVPQAASGGVPAAAPEFELEVMEGTSDDDLWGAFELENVADVEGDYVGESPFEVEAPAVGTEEVDEPFVFAEEGTLPPEAAVESLDFAPKWEPVAESEFSFGETAEPPPVDIGLEEQFGVFEEEAAPVFEAAQSESEDFFSESAEPAVPEFAGRQSSIPPAEPEIELQFAPEEEYVPVLEPMASPQASAGEEPELLFAPEEEFMPAAEALTAFTSPVPPPSPGFPAPDLVFAPEEERLPASAPLMTSGAPPAASTAAGASLSDDQLATLVSRISRDIIEKIAWEVVPDLAERIINEEIRKIKEGN